jgi:hypothetical protein
MVRIHHKPQRFRPCPLGRPDEYFPHTARSVGRGRFGYSAPRGGGSVCVTDAGGESGAGGRDAGVAQRISGELVELQAASSRNSLGLVNQRANRSTKSVPYGETLKQHRELPEQSNAASSHVPRRRDPPSKSELRFERERTQDISRSALGEE